MSRSSYGGTVSPHDLPPGLRSCNLVVNQEATAENRALLSMLRRSMKMSCALIVEGNANLLLFNLQQHATVVTSVLSNDIRCDHRLKPTAGSRIGHGIRKYLGFKVDLGYGSSGTLLMTSQLIGNFDPVHIDNVRDVVKMIGDRYSLRTEEARRVYSSCLLLPSVLLSNVAVYTQLATSLINPIDNSKQELSDMAGNKQISPNWFRTLERYCKRLQVVVENINTATDRLSTVARRYSEPDTKKYYLSCFQYRSEGFVDQVNEMLLEVSKLIPDHHLSWTFHLDAEVVDNSSGHRTFYQHLFFFLEGILLRWSDCCSSSHILIEFTPQDRVVVDHRQSSDLPNSTSSDMDLGYVSVTFTPLTFKDVEDSFFSAISRSNDFVEILHTSLHTVDHSAGLEIINNTPRDSFLTQTVGNALIAYRIIIPMHVYLQDMSTSVVADSHMVSTSFEAAIPAISSRSSQHTRLLGLEVSRRSVYHSSFSAQSMKDLVRMRRASIRSDHSSSRRNKVWAEISCAIDLSRDTAHSPLRQSIICNDVKLVEVEEEECVEVAGNKTGGESQWMLPSQKEDLPRQYSTTLEVPMKASRRPLWRRLLFSLFCCCYRGTR